MSSGQFRIKVFFRELSRAGRGVAAAGGHGAQPGVDSRACDTRVCSHGRRGCSGRAAAAASRRSPRAVPGPTLPGTECPAGSARTCPKPSSAQRQGTAGSGGRGAPGHRGRTEYSRPPSPGLPQPRCPCPAGPGPAGPPAELPPASRVPHSPYLAPGPGASGGGGRGRRPARLPRFRRSQELNIPPLRAAPMRKTSRQQHHLPPNVEAPASLPPGTPGPVPSGEVGAPGRGEPVCCTTPVRLDALGWEGDSRKGDVRVAGASVGSSTGTLEILRRSQGLLLWLVTFKMKCPRFPLEEPESIASVNKTWHLASGRKEIDRGGWSWRGKREERLQK